MSHISVSETGEKIGVERINFYMGNCLTTFLLCHSVLSYNWGEIYTIIIYCLRLSNSLDFATVSHGPSLVSEFIFQVKKILTYDGAGTLSGDH